MGFYANTIVPRLVTCACGTKPILKQREKVVPEARGQVLEIGMGAGHNLPYYQREQVERIVGIDPCSTSWGLAQPRAKSWECRLSLSRVRRNRCRYPMRLLIPS